MACREVKEQYRIPSNTESSALVGLEDLFITMCDLAHVPVDQARQAVDSISFAQTLLQDPDLSRRQWLYTSFDKPPGKNLTDEHTFRYGNLKLISYQQEKEGAKFGNTFNRRLYNLSSDLKETRNLVDKPEYQDVLALMIRKLEKYAGPRTRANAPFCNIDYCGIGEDEEEEEEEEEETAECPFCGINDDGRPSCCAAGGAWRGKCGDDVDKEHTWGEGFRACRCECTRN